MTDLVRGIDADTLNSLVEGTSESQWKTIDQEAATLVVAALDPALDNEPGVYLEDCQMKRPSKWAVDPEEAERRRWKLSEDFDYGEGKEHSMEIKEKASRL